MEETETNELKFTMGELLQITVRGADVVHLSNAIVSVSGILNRQGAAEGQQAEEDQSENAAKKQQEPGKK